MTDVVAVIAGKKRDAVHELLVEHLGGLGDVRIAMDRGDVETARRLAREFTEDFRLLDDIGWGLRLPLRSLQPPVNVLSDNAKRGGAAQTTRPRLTRWNLMSVSQDTSAPAAGPGCGDKRRLRKTKTSGVFKRLGADGGVIGYVCVFRSAGRQRKRSARTYEEAKRIKRESETDRDRGELQERTTVTLLLYLDEWVERYRGQGRRGFRENTRDEYRRLIRIYARPYFSSRLKLTELTTYQLARFLDWLADEQEQGRHLSDRTIANISMPIRAALASAKREGLIRHNPAQGLALSQRERLEGETDEIKVFSREQLAAIMAMAPDRHRPLFELLATCGLRISEAVALQRLHLQLDGPEPEVCVRRAIVRERIEPPKSRHGRREVRLSASATASLRDHLAQLDQDSTALAFPNEAGGPLDPGNLRRRVLKPLAEEAAAPWAGFHTFRHTFASLHLSQGTNLLQLSRALGHHSPAFTLTRYTHLLPGDEAPVLDLSLTGSSGQA